MTARTIQITTADGASHDFDLSPDGSDWAVTHPATKKTAGRAVKTERTWAAHVQDSVIPCNEGDSLHEEWFGDEYAAAYAVAQEYARRFLDTTPDPDVIPDDFEIKIPEGAVYHEDAFTIEQDENGENRQYEHAEVKDMDPHHVWTVVESGSDDGPYWALPGFHFVNRDHYRVTAEAWKDEDAAKQYVA